MCSKLEDLKAADGNKIFAYHLNDCEDLPLGSCGDDKRLWPGEGVVDHESIASALKEIDLMEFARLKNSDLNITKCHMMKM